MSEKTRLYQLMEWKTVDDDMNESLVVLEDDAAKDTNITEEMKGILHGAGWYRCILPEYIQMRSKMKYRASRILELMGTNKPFRAYMVLVGELSNAYLYSIMLAKGYRGNNATLKSAAKENDAVIKMLLDLDKPKATVGKAEDEAPAEFGYRRLANILDGREDDGDKKGRPGKGRPKKATVGKD